MGATEDLSKFIAELSYEDLPGATVKAAKAAILDGFANMIAGSTQPVATIMSNYTKALGGTEHGTVIGHGFRTNAPSAAFANGVFGHCLDFEIQGFPPTHGTSSCLPAALAIGEMVNATGKTIILAYTLGWEIQGRLRAASAGAANQGYHPPGLVGPLGGAAAASKALGLDAERTEMALGIGASRTGGLTANTGTMVKSTHPGNASRMGAESALLAQMDFSSTKGILETRNGYADALFGGNMDWEVVNGGLGQEFRIVDPGFDIKRFPAQITMQRPIEAVINLKERHNLTPSTIDSLTIELRGEGHSGHYPRTGLDGKFSVQYCGAAAMLDGQVNIETFTDERRFAPDMENLLPKVTVLANNDIEGVRATARRTDGQIVSETCVNFRGSHANPMDDDERFAKFRYCARHLLSEQDTEQLLTTITNLENVGDIAQVMDVIRR